MLCGRRCLCCINSHQKSHRVLDGFPFSWCSVAVWGGRRAAVIPETCGNGAGRRSHEDAALQVRTCPRVWPQAAPLPVANRSLPGRIRAAALCHLCSHCPGNDPEHKTPNPSVNPALAWLPLAPLAWTGAVFLSHPLQRRPGYAALVTTRTVPNSSSKKPCAGFGHCWRGKPRPGLPQP